MPERTDWEERARGIIRGEMARRGVTYAQLAEKLGQLRLTRTNETCGIRSAGGNSPQGSCCNAWPHWECSNCAWTDHRCIGRASSGLNYPPSKANQYPTAGKETGAEHSQKSCQLKQETDADRLIPRLNAIERAIRDLTPRRFSTERARQEQHQIAHLHAHRTWLLGKSMSWATFVTVGVDVCRRLC